MHLKDGEPLNKVLANTYVTPNIISYRPQCKITFSDSTYPEETIVSLFNASENYITSPFQIGRYHYILIKHSESGSRIKPLEEVREEIIAQIREEKYPAYYQQKLAELKQKYTLIDNIDYDALIADYADAP